jgi:hypothetical protein
MDELPVHVTKPENLRSLVESARDIFSGERRSQAEDAPHICPIESTKHVEPIGAGCCEIDPCFVGGLVECLGLRRRR